MITDRYVQQLTRASGGLAELGGKGESLARLAAARFPVPDGFVVTTTAYQAYVSTYGLAPLIEREVERPKAIEPLFHDHPVPTNLAQAIAAAYRDLRRPAVAVRSYATAEDLPKASFAGQQETYLNVVGEEALLEAVRRCWASLWTERAITYRARHGIPNRGLALAVVVQRLVDADAAGILFTADPITGATDVVQINSAWGLGESVVGGRVTPDIFRVDAATSRIISSTVSDKQVMTVRQSPGITTRTVPAGRRRKPTLTPRQAERLATLGLGVAERYGGPVDVEWCRTGNQFFILQARPITTSAEVCEPDPWNDSKSTYALWTSTNVGEAMPDVLTPASWSMVQLLMRVAMATSSIPPRVAYGRIGGRTYLNVSELHALARTVGISESRVRLLTQELFGQIPDELPIPRVEASRLSVLRSAIPVAVDVLRRARRDLKRFDTYLDAHPALCQERRTAISRVHDPRALASLWRQVILPEFESVNWMLSAATRSGGLSFVRTRQRLQTLVGEADANAITTGLGGSSGDLASLGLLRGLSELAAGRIDPETFGLTYGHRGPHEFEIATPRPAEDPRWIDDQLAQQQMADVNYQELLLRQAAARESAWRRLRAKHPRRARTFQRRIAEWSTLARNREKARSEVVRYFWVLRAYLLRAGELTGLGDDIFFLDADQIATALEGARVDQQAIAENRRAYEAYRALPNYPPLIVGHFDPFVWAADPRRRTDIYIDGAETVSSSLIRGFPGAAGEVVAIARVIDDPDDTTQLQTGEILVTAVTNVGWTPIFPRLAAVVTDVGAPLSHAAIVARELGIPAVVGCGNATGIIRTGDRIKVNGSTGVVEKHRAGELGRIWSASSAPQRLQR